LTEARLGPMTPFGLAARATVSTLFDQMMRHLDGTRKGIDIEALHDMRVASRRLRSALRVFRGCLPKPVLKEVEREVKGVTQALGQVRDQDVFIDYLRSQEANTTDGDLEWLIDNESQIREEARLRMIDSLDQLEKGNLPEKVQSMLNGASMIQSEGKSCKRYSFAAQAPTQIGARLNELREASKAIGDAADAEGLHTIRIAAKRLRYTMEAFAPCFGKALKDRIAAVKLLQEQLGAVHDCDVWLAKLQRYLADADISKERRARVEQLINERRQHRAAKYAEALAHWNCLTGERFAERLMELVSTCEIVGDEGEEVNNMQQVKRARRTTKVEAGTEPSEIIEVIEKPQANKAESIADSTLEPLMANLRNAASAIAAVERIDQKLAKQIHKLLALLDEAPADVEDPAKTQKNIDKLAACLAEAQGNGAPTSKDAEKLAERVRTARKKLAKSIRKTTDRETS